jgi:hypothetical protein
VPWKKAEPTPTTHVKKYINENLEITFDLSTGRSIPPLKTTLQADRESNNGPQGNYQR